MVFGGHTASFLFGYKFIILFIMGCNCKKTAKAASKYSNDSDRETAGFFEGLWNIAETVFIIISVFLLIIITLPVSVPVIIYSAFTRHSIRIDRLTRRNRAKKQNIQDKD